MNKHEVLKGMYMVAIPSGSFTMGHIYDKDEDVAGNINVFYPDEQPAHTVKLKAFQLGETQITQAQYREITGVNPSTFTGNSFPVTNIGPSEIMKFCNLLSKQMSLDLCYDEKQKTSDFSKNGFRMPTEAEWEYACRAGTSSHFYTGNTEKDLNRAGWYLGNSGRKTHPVAQKEPNAWGLYDMHGNVFEYCNDDWNPGMCYGKYLTVHDIIPTFHYYHSLNMTRGGSWFSEPSVCRSAARSCFCSWEGINQSYYMGFRVARNIG
ncbi:MAG: formylglycine-generating enzyme family protein [Candidatus Latescibacteria bacterium]|nr:formylglycine-generating enzyme family protein [Candidatus Latescibacterota bacterium]